MRHVGPLHDRVVEQLKGQILADIESGRVPDDVGSLGGLRDYVDVYKYDQASAAEVVDAFISDVGADIDAWLRQRRETQRLYERSLLAHSRPGKDT